MLFAILVSSKDPLPSFPSLRSTSNLGLKFEKDHGDDRLVIDHIDSDYVGDLDKRRSTTGDVFTMAGGPRTGHRLLR